MAKITVFHLQRKKDESGVSGTGRVAEGVVFSNGMIALTWLGSRTSLVFYKDMGDIEAIHGHGGNTEIVIDITYDG